MSDNRSYNGDKKHRGNRGGVKKRMAMSGIGGLGNFGNPGGPGPLRSYPRPPYMPGGNSMPGPYGMPSRPNFMPTNPSGKYGFFDGPQAFGPPGYEKRSDAALKSSGIREAPQKPMVIPPLMRPPGPNDYLNRLENGQLGLQAERNGPVAPPPLAQSPNKDGVPLNETGPEGINELFAKMVWKKLDSIKDPVRLSRLHIEIMNILQMAIAEESAQQRQ